jgi:hypothetical protein
MKKSVFRHCVYCPFFPLCLPQICSPCILVLRPAPVVFFLIFLLISCNCVLIFDLMLWFSLLRIVRSFGSLVLVCSNRFGSCQFIWSCSKLKYFFNLVPFKDRRAPTDLSCLILARLHFSPAASSEVRSPLIFLLGFGPQSPLRIPLRSRQVIGQIL